MDFYSYFSLKLKRKMFFCKKSKNIYGFNAKDKFFKLALGQSVNTLKKEYHSSMHVISTDSVWSKSVLKYDCLVDFKYLFCIHCRKMKRFAKLQEIDIFVQNILESLHSNLIYQPWHKTLNQKRFKTIWKILTSKQKKYVSSVLDGIYLPVTGAHGDFLDKNIMVDQDNKIKVIDWEYYRPHGSVVTDVINYYHSRSRGIYAGKKSDPTPLEKYGLPVDLHKAMLYSKKKASLKQLSVLSVVSKATAPGRTHKRGKSLRSSLSSLGIE